MQENFNIPPNISTTPKLRNNQTTSFMLPLNSHSPAKQPSFRLKYIIPFLILIIGIIVFILFFVFRNGQNLGNNSTLSLDRNDSDESYSSITDESELELSTEYDEQAMSTGTIPQLSSMLQQPKSSETHSKRKGGRTISQLDPDAY
jgi:hypothetical protein